MPLMPLTPILAGLASLVLMALAAPALQAHFWPALALSAWQAQWCSATLALLLTALLSAVATALSRRRHAGEARPAPGAWRPGLRTMPAAQAGQDLRAMPPVLEAIGQHLQGALSDSEQGSLQLIERMNAIHRGSIEQFERIRCTEENGQELNRIMQDKAMVDAQLGAILQMFVETQESEVQANLERLNRLQEVKALAPLVDVIATVARQTNFMSINAAIEAARAGESGRSFAVLAAEIRELSNRTAAVAVDIGQRINAATDGIDQELAKVTEASNRQTSSGNMRQVISDIAEMQQRFVNSMAKLQLHEVIAEVKAGHQDIEGRISDALGEMQVQDVVRQRVLTVQQALQALDEHLQAMAGQLVDQAWQPDAQLALKARLDTLLQDSAGRAPAQQTGAQCAAGGTSATAGPAERIELF